MWQTIIGVAGRSNAGVLFYESGPQRGMQRLAAFLQHQMDLGRLRQADPLVAARHLTGLLESQSLMPCVLGLLKAPSQEYLRGVAQQALQTFLWGYAAGRPAA